MTDSFDDEYGERLRRTLRAEADSVTPSPEGLDRIRTKINRRRERRLGLWYALPWLRPFAAVAAAIFVSVIAVSATPALKNFVQTGHFSPDTGSGSHQKTEHTGHSPVQVPPGGPSAPAPSVSPSPTAIRPTLNGKHVVNGNDCPSGEGTITPPGSPPPHMAPARATPKITCSPEPGTSSAPPVQATTPPPDNETPTQVPPSDLPPTTEHQPSTDSSP